MVRRLYPSDPVLLVDDEQHILNSYTMALRMNGIENVQSCEDSRKVRRLLKDQAFSVCILDLVMPHITGEELLGEIRQEYPGMPVIVVTGLNEVDSAVRCMKEGAFDYIVKPVEKETLVASIKRAMEMSELKGENRLLKESVLTGTLAAPEAFTEIITQSRRMQGIFQYVEAIVQSRQTILITGETGVGKDLLVRAIHRLSNPEQPLVSANVAGIDDNAFSDTLFGHVKGAFTGAEKRRMGLIEKAANGILHLDEIGDLNLESQIKLLRLLEEGEYFPLGSDTPRVAHARLIMTTNRDIEKLRESNQFRPDLYYRLSTHQILIPPLRERKEDIPFLVDHFVEEASGSMGKEYPFVSPEDAQMLLRYSFPGNVRELKSMVYDAVSQCDGKRISIQDFKKMDALGDEGFLKESPSTVFKNSHAYQKWEQTDLPTLEEATVNLIVEAMRRFNNKSMAARVLGISRQRVARYIQKYNLIH